MEFEKVIIETRGKVRERRASVRSMEHDLAIERKSLEVEEADLHTLERIAQSMGIVVLDLDLGLTKAGDWLAKERTVAVEDVLLGATETLSPSEIADVLRSYGRDDDYEQVSATLAHLKRSNRAVLVGRARWISPGSTYGMSVLNGPHPLDSNDRPLETEGVGDA